MAPLGAALVAIGTILFPPARAMRPEHSHDPVSAEHTFQDVELAAVEGRGSLAEGCQPFPGKRVVLVTVNSEFLDMFTNWLRSAKPHLGATEQLLIIAEDDAAAAPIEAYMQDQELNYSVASPQQAQNASELVEAPYRTKEYGRMMWNRPKYMMNLALVGCSVMYHDIDTVWMKDPFLAIEAAGRADLYISDDDPEHPEFHNLCAGFMYVHPSGASKALLQRWTEAQDGLSNQKIFNTVLQGAMAENAAPHMQVLPFEEFPPGGLVVHPHNSAILDTAPANPTVWHANWRRGREEKIHFFIMLDQWKPAPI